MRPRIFKRGGARPRATRISEALALKEVDKIARAIRIAEEIGLPLNRFITIHWERAGVADHQAARATGRFLKLARDNLASKRLPFAYVWVRENDEGDGSKGDHAHILAHVPDGRTLGPAQRRWIKIISGKPYRKQVIHTRVIARHSNAAQNEPALYRLNLTIVRDYILKGASGPASIAFDLPLWGRGGRVQGQRIGMSKNLSRSISRKPVR